MKIVEFESSKTKTQKAVQEDLIETLEGLLERAKAGTLESFAFVTVSPEKTIGSGWSGLGRIELGHAISLLDHRYYDACLEELYDEN